MTILEQITQYKRKEVAARKELIPENLLRTFPSYQRTPASLKESIQSKAFGIIAEHKRKSPSKSVINDKALLDEVVKGYETAGAAGISVLTDTKYFGGSLDDLVLARQTVQCPILRKEFIIDPYQIVEAKAYGADVILLIAACLTASEIEDFSEHAKDLGLEVLLEVHNLEELKKSLFPTIDLIGVNNRNLKTFEVSIETSIQLAKYIPDDYLKVTESGLKSTDEIKTLKAHGYDGFLMGEHFMKTDNPGKGLSQMLHSL